VLNTDLTNKVDTANDTGCVFRFFFANVLARAGANAALLD
jgi:hypothetical protein